MNKKILTSIATVGMITAFVTVAYAGSTTYSFNHTGYGGSAKKNFTLSSDAYLNVSGSQSASVSGVTSSCYYSVYKKGLIFDDEIIPQFLQQRNGTIGFSSSSKLKAGDYYLDIVCNTNSTTTGTISW
ncbi:hypothetical protein EV586_101572 [Tumebacillus sp. BK434]|uniref:hypothetical protein n=1 Tax=Tumebacillus sp. BK434 TaxID=2512169 RepID=UPI001050A9C0|nr:hypothetical protein [Tumebacillus sp. BK434]TCP59356.1 hypothetical protein EV586_101572 [Tumebacillus sp. BK434]